MRVKRMGFPAGSPLYPRDLGKSPSPFLRHLLNEHDRSYLIRLVKNLSS